MKFLKVLVLFSFFVSIGFSQDVKLLEKQLDEAISFMKEKKFNKAKEVLNNSSLLSTVYEYEALNYIGLCEFNLDNMSAAEIYFKRSIEIREDFPESRNNIGYMYILNKNYSGARAELEMALKLFPEHAEAKKNLNLLSKIEKGILSIETIELFRNANSSEDIDEAIKVFESIIIEHPKFKEVRNNLAVSYFLKGDMEKAERLLRTTVKNHTKYSEAYNNLGFIFYAQEKYNTAIRYFLTALKLQPTYMVALNNLGDVYFDNDAFARAEKVWRTALELEPLNKILKDKIIMLENQKL